MGVIESSANGIVTIVSYGLGVLLLTGFIMFLVSLLPEEE